MACDQLCKVSLKFSDSVTLQVRRMEFEGQIRQLQQMLQQQKEAEEELVARIGKLQEEKRELQDRLANFQRGLSNAEQEKRELERAHVRLEKDKKALRNTLDKVRMEFAGPEIKFKTFCTSLIHQYGSFSLNKT